MTHLHIWFMIYLLFWWVFDDDFPVHQPLNYQRVILKTFDTRTSCTLDCPLPAKGIQRLGWCVRENQNLQTFQRVSLVCLKIRYPVYPPNLTLYGSLYHHFSDTLAINWWLISTFQRPMSDRPSHRSLQLGPCSSFGWAHGHTYGGHHILTLGGYIFHQGYTSAWKKQLHRTPKKKFQVPFKRLGMMWGTAVDP